jgi:putative membrane protein
VTPESSARKEEQDQVRLAQERTFLSHERTLMAWIRTAASLIMFGFTLFQFFQYLDEYNPSKIRHRLFNPRTYGSVMIVSGVVTLALAAWQHWKSMNRLRAEYPEAPLSLALLMAGLISVLGILALVATVAR